MKKNLREVVAFSSNAREELDYRKRYWFHHWITKETALLENERGELITAYFSEFRFKVEKDEEEKNENDKEDFLDSFVIGHPLVSNKIQNALSFLGEPQRKACNLSHKDNITFRELKRMGSASFRKLRNIGNKSVTEIRDLFIEKGFENW